jgi:2-C-methyl-D-erythritol 4-phosphate cytidylyltransferase
LVNIQLPQVFNTEILKQAHEKGKGKNYSDDSSLVFAEMNVFPTLINGLEQNIKITTKLDILLSEVLYEEIGNGDWRV